MQDTVVRKYLHRTTVYDVSKEGRKNWILFSISHTNKCGNFLSRQTEV